MKLLIFSHSSQHGGAETALRNLVSRLLLLHEVHIVFPSLEGVEVRHYDAMGVPCFELPLGFWLPHLSSTLVVARNFSWQTIIESLAPQKYDLVLSNTLAILHGNLIAHLLGLPHVTYVHEYLDDPELAPTVITKQKFLDLVESGSTGIISCSSMVMGQFSSKTKQPRLVLPPYSFPKPRIGRQQPSQEDLVLQVIGNVSFRKNVTFAADVTKALGVLGHKVRLDIIGNGGNSINRVQRVLEKRGISARLINHEIDPYVINSNSRVITLVCSTTEPYGLTVAESLYQGIPVVASMSGGPSELLRPNRLYPVNDIDVCARILLSIWQDYPAACIDASLNYQDLHETYHSPAKTAEFEAFLAAAHQTVPSSYSGIKDLMSLTDSIADVPLDTPQLKQSLLNVANYNELSLTLDEIDFLIEQERNLPGNAVTTDIKRFGVIPFGSSEAMERLYREGLGLAIELVATSGDEGRLQMAAFIGCHLKQETQDKNQQLSILALGDGTALDSIRLAAAGFFVDYIDVDKSNMSKVAAENIATYARTTAGPSNNIPRIIEQVEYQYDAIVCLEVIQHLSDPISFISFISRCLKPGGVAYVSECFNGVQDRWPTHIATNELYAGLLPFMMLDSFQLETYNKLPFGKPYVFRKYEGEDSPQVMKLLLDRDLLLNLLIQRLDIGV